MPTYSDPSRPQPVPTIQIQSNLFDFSPYLVLIAGLILSVFAGILYVKTVAAQNATTVAQQQLTSTQTDRDALNPVVFEAVTYNMLGDNLKKLFDSQKLWSATLTGLEKNLYRHLAVTNLQFDDKGTMTLSGTTTSYTDYAKIYSSFTDPSVASIFQNVTPAAVVKDDKGNVSFTFTMLLAPSQIKYASSALY